MPRKKNCKGTRRSSLETSNVQSESPALGDTLTECNQNYIETEIDEKFQELYEELAVKKNIALSTLDFHFKNLMISIPQSILNLPIDMNDENLMKIFTKTSSENCEFNVDDSSALVQTTVKRRRSRSEMREQSNQYGVKRINSRASKRRSNSLNMYRTPANKVWLQALTSAKKYTVSKPAKVEESGISLKRLIRPDEEAISITGSPLLVQPTVASAPTINIPLPGGVVMNILPKRPRGHFPVPDFDETTRQQLKLLCQQLKEMV